MMGVRMNESITKETWLNRNTSSILAITTVVLSFAMFFVVIRFDLTPEREQILIYILGMLSAIDTQIFSYYFGSSQGSREKDKKSSVATNG
jgi:hypothetical protein